MGTVAIVGLGLIGGSMGLALKRAEPVDTEIIGYDRDEDVGLRALEAKAVQRLTPTLEEAAREATMMIIATPIISIRRIFETIAPHLRPGAVITDVASTKAEVLHWANTLLPDSVHFVGGHPMAGKETSGPEAAEESLFEGRPYCVVPSHTAGGGAVKAVLDVIEAIKAQPFFLDADEHDSYAAAISHVPLVASIALFQLARGTNAWPELANMAGPGFRDLTRLASGEPEMSHDIFLTNQANIIHWLDRYITELTKLAEMIAGDDTEALFRSLVETQMERDNFLEGPPSRERPDKDPAIELPSPAEHLMTMMAGNLWRQRGADIMKATEERRKKREMEARMRRKP